MKSIFIHSKVKVCNLLNKTMETIVYDAVFVCNGHSFLPNVPKFDGIEQFEGGKLHSHDYRHADIFKSLYLHRFIASGRIFF